MERETDAKTNAHNISRAVLPGDEGQCVATGATGSFAIRLQVDNAASFALHRDAV